MRPRKTPTPRTPEPATIPLPAGVVPVSEALDAAVELLTWRMDHVARALGISRRVLEHERAAGRFPPPDLQIGRMPMWMPQTIRTWVERGGRP
jgi:hypothetical protein